MRPSSRPTTGEADREVKSPLIGSPRSKLADRRDVSLGLAIRTGAALQLQTGASSFSASSASSSVGAKALTSARSLTAGAAGGERPDQCFSSNPDAPVTYMGNNFGPQGHPRGGKRIARRKIKKLKPGQKIYDFYYWEEVLQEDGNGGKVVVCRHKMAEDKEFKYVLKIRSKASVEQEADPEAFRKMLKRVLNLPPHFGVMSFVEVLENDEYYYLVMDKADQGSLLQCLVARHTDGCVPEGELKDLTREVLEALAHIHQQGIVHRDVKPDNLVVRKLNDPMSPGGKTERVTLIDFDHAETDYSPYSPALKDDGIWGTCGFNAPETYLGQYSPSSDIFSVGVILYLLMAGKMPFPVAEFEAEADVLHKSFGSPRNVLATSRAAELASPRSPGRTQANWGKDPFRETQTPVTNTWCTWVHDKFMTSAIDWDCDPWPTNKPCREFCQWLLALNPRNRPGTAEEALEHAYLQMS